MRSRGGQSGTPLPNQAVGAGVGRRDAAELKNAGRERRNDEVNDGRAGGMFWLGDEGGEFGAALPNPRTGARIGCRVLKAADMIPWESAERKDENWMAGDHRCYHAWHPKQCAPPRSRGPAPSPALAAREGAEGSTKLKGGNTSRMIETLKAKTAEHRGYRTECTAGYDMRAGKVR